MFSSLLTGLIQTAFNFFDAQEIREEIDDFLDKLENKAAAKPDGPKKVAFTSALVLARTITGIPDDIGGDED